VNTSITAIATDEFERKWRPSYRSIFSGRGLGDGPFQQTQWREFGIGAPAYYFPLDQSVISPQDRKHSAIYVAILRAIEVCGDQELIGFLLDGPHLNASIFQTNRLVLGAFTEMRNAAVDGFDLHIFGPSAAWGLAISWDEEVAAIAGGPDFVAALLRECGGEDPIREDFETSSAYLEKVSEYGRWLRKQLLAHSGWQ
jgi:hypothetical protein